jgi:hypothetical protein
VVRVDRDFASALLDSDAEVPLVPDWLSRLPFDTFACSLAEPMPLDDGSKVCYYRGFLASGIRPKPVGAVDGPSGRVWTTYGPLTEADGIRFLWLFNHQMDPTPRAQTVNLGLHTAPLRVGSCGVSVRAGQGFLGRRPILGRLGGLAGSGG